MARIEEAALKALDKKAGFMKFYYRNGPGQKFIKIRELIKGYREVVNELEGKRNSRRGDGKSRSVSKEKET